MPLLFSGMCPFSGTWRRPARTNEGRNEGGCAPELWLARIPGCMECFVVCYPSRSRLEKNALTVNTYLFTYIRRTNHSHLLRCPPCAAPHGNRPILSPSLQSPTQCSSTTTPSTSPAPPSGDRAMRPPLGSSVTPRSSTAVCKFFLSSLFRICMYLSLCYQCYYMCKYRDRMAQESYLTNIFFLFISCKITNK